MAQMVKKILAGDLGLILGSGRSPGEGNGNPLQYSCLENPMDTRSLANCSPWGCKRVGQDLVTTQQHWHFQSIFTSEEGYIVTII